MSHINQQFKYLGVIRNTNMQAGVGVDLGYVAINPNKNYHTISIHAVSKTAAGTLIAGTIAAYSQANAGGTNVVGAMALTNLTGSGLTQIITSAVTTSFNSDSVYIRLTAVSINAGTVDFYIYGYEESL